MWSSGSSSALSPCVSTGGRDLWLISVLVLTLTTVHLTGSGLSPGPDHNHSPVPGSGPHPEPVVRVLCGGVQCGSVAPVLYLLLDCRPEAELGSCSVYLYDGSYYNYNYGN